MKYHPDTNPDVDPVEFQIISAAAKILKKYFKNINR